MQFELFGDARRAMAPAASSLPPRVSWDWAMRDDYPALDASAPSVFSCFHCAGGSTMGYKLAGCRVLGGVEIDEHMMRVYRANHAPEHSYCEDLRDFNRRTCSSLPDELFGVDVLDGSPPCTPFSTSNIRWLEQRGVARRHNEGAAYQTLADLPLVFAETVALLRPKIVVMENVPAMQWRHGKRILRDVITRLSAAGYASQSFVLDASRMGVPQRRRRLFVVARQRALGWPDLTLGFDEPPVPFGDVREHGPAPIAPAYLRQIMPYVDVDDRTLIPAYQRREGKRGLFSHIIIDDADVAPTLTTKETTHVRPYLRPLFQSEAARLATFPHDFNFLDVRPWYAVGMSVPPLMMQRLALELRRQWLVGA